MSGKRVAIVSPTWEPFYEETQIPAAIRAGDQLHVSGHTGEDPDGQFPAQMEAQPSSWKRPCLPGPPWE